jgi:HD-like signal output (HDOD) protein
MAQKWNFPDQLVEGIKFHHEPLRGSLVHKNIVFCVYLANALCNIERGNLNYEHVEPMVLRDFAINDEVRFRKVHRSLRFSYEKQRTRQDATGEKKTGGSQPRTGRQTKAG